MVSVGQSLIVGLVAGLVAVVAPIALRTAKARRSSPFHGSIGRVLTWKSDHGVMEVLSGPARGEQLTLSRARLGDAGDGDGIGLIAAQHEEMCVVLT